MPGSRAPRRVRPVADGPQAAAQSEGRSATGLGGRRGWSRPAASSTTCSAGSEVSRSTCVPPRSISSGCCPPCSRSSSASPTRPVSRSSSSTKGSRDASRPRWRPRPTGSCRKPSRTSPDMPEWAPPPSGSGPPRRCLGVQIEDRGRGFDPEAVLAATRSHGLAGMQERVDLLGGHLAIESRPGEGSRLTAELPLRDRRGRQSDVDIHRPGR